ncbi:MAG TPA: methyltransferase domain-containing protein [Polyangia bacterium]|jgi:trans-aconitate 2-methyltransferase|nr:methyltransferase domain-containing protein [Polyangia bacterium]
MSWNPEQYLKFAMPRLRPAVDLLARVAVDAPHVVYDLGCGAGNVTRLLAQRWPAAALTGVDDSASMLAKAAGELPGARWQRQSLETWTPPQPADVIFSNAALQWLPAHETLLPRLVGQLAPGGVLAVQMPRNFLAPSHTAIAEAVASGPWRDKLTPLLRRNPVAEPDAYYALLAPLVASLDIWQTEYLHVLEGRDPVKEWTNGTWLKTFLDALAAEERAAFEAAYAARVALAYPPQADGKTLFPFRRIFIVAVAAV